VVAELDQVRAELIVVALAFALACDRPSSDTEDGRSAVGRTPANTPSPGVVDSIFPPEELLRRFRTGLDTVRVLDGPHSRDSLVSRYLEAIRRRDWAALGRLTVSRAEYAYLVYPELTISRPPYRQPPEVAWLLLEAGNGSAIQKLTGKAAERFAFLGYDCPQPPETQGVLRLHTRCTMRVREDGQARDVRLFGTIIERDGRWKFLALEGDL